MQVLPFHNRRFRFLFTLLLLVPLFSLSQSVPGPFDVNSFSDLSDARNKLNALIPNLENQIESIYTRDTSIIMDDINNNNFSITYYQDAISKVKNPDDTSLNALKNNLYYFQQRKEQLYNELDKSKRNLTEKQGLTKRIDSAKNALNNVEYKINQLMIPRISQQNFLFWASTAFVFLMGILLFTFYFVVRRDSAVRISIFGSDSGLQFVTLFSIVIAIILFGLTGVLEGKELSALLGSVAGYILGKVKFSGNSDNKEKENEGKQDAPD